MARDEASFGINTYAYTGSHSAADCLSRLADQGHTDFELMMVPGHFWPAHADAAARRALRQLVEARGLRLVSLNAPNIDLNIAALAEEMRRHTLGLLHAILGLAGDLGVPGVVIGPGKANPLMPAPEDVLLGHFLRALDELAPHAERLGTKLYVENMPFAFLPKADQLMAALKRYDDERIKVVYDVANGHFAGEDPGAGCAGSPTASPSSTSRTRRARPIAIARSARAACRSPRCHWCSRRSATATRRSSRSSPPTPTGRSPTASAGCSSWAGGAASGARASSHRARFDPKGAWLRRGMMTKTTATIADAGKTTHTYRVVVEPDEDAWHAWCPALQCYGAATWGSTEAEALRHIQEVVAMIVAELIEDGETLPADEAGSAGTLVSVTI